MKNSKKLLAVFIIGLLLVVTLAGAALPVLAAAFSTSLSSYSGVPNSTLYVYGS